MVAEPRDASLSFLQRLENSDEWIVRDDVPIFAEHEVRDDKGNLIEKFGRAELQEYADNCNRRELETGDATPIMIGHIDQDATEISLGDIVGYGRQFKVARYGPKQKLGVLVKAYFRKDKYDLAMEHPRRSVERWKKDKIFDPICLLKRTPKLDLGILTYQRSEQARRSDRVLYLMPDDPEHCGATMNDETLPLLNQILQKLDQMCQGMQGGMNYQAGMGSAPALPSGTNMSMPKPDSYAKPVGLNPAFDPTTNVTTTTNSNQFVAAVQQPPIDKEKQRMADETKSIEVARYEREKEELNTRLKALEEANKGLAAKYQRAECERQVTQLQAEGYSLDRAEEVEALAALPDEASRTKYMDRIRKRYQRNGAPVDYGRQAGDASFIPTIALNTESDANREADFEAAVQYAREKGCSFDAAEAAIKGQRQQGKVA